MKKAMENAREYGIGYVDEYIASNLEEWRGLDYPAFCRTLVNANDPAFFDYDAAVEAAWDELQRLLEEDAE